MTTTLTTGDPGLDLALGGGVVTLARTEELAESAAILIRGGPGAGKTILGCQLAVALAGQRSGDVAYGCVELLPTELRAQMRSVWRGSLGGESADMMAATAGSGIVLPPFSRNPLPITRVYAATLQLDAEGALDGMGAALDELLLAIEEAEGKPSVLVIDSLARGYGLAGAPREFVDALVKMALARGLVLVLLEEGTAESPTEWAYAMDVVLELEHVDRSSTPAAQLERRLWVTKNRFAGSVVGPHRFSILEGDGLRVFPAEVTYQTPWARAKVGETWNVAEPTGLWGVPAIDDVAAEFGWTPRPGDSIYVSGPEADVVRQVATAVLPTSKGRDVWLRFGQPGAPHLGQQDIVFGFDDPFLSPERLVDSALHVLDGLSAQGAWIARVVAGDLAALRLYWDAAGLQRALAGLLSVLDARAVPAVLFETAGSLELRSALMDWTAAAAEARSKNADSFTVHLTHARSPAVAVGTLPRRARW